MILNIIKNKDKLEMHKVEIFNNIKILECLSKDKIVEISSYEMDGGIYSLDVYKNLIKYYNRRDVKLIISPELIYPYAKEIILMLTSLGLIEVWDDKFWDSENDIHVPKVNVMVKHIENILIYKTLAA